MDFEQMMRRYKIDSMKYDQRVNGGASGYNMNDWNQQYSASPPSSRNGEDDTSSVTHSRPRRSRLDKDIPHSRGPIIIQPAPSQSRKSTKHGNMQMNNGGSRGHNSTFNGYDLLFKRYQHNSSRGPNESFSGIFPQSRNVSGYASDYMNSRMGIGLMNNTTEPKRPRSTAAERYTSHATPRNGFGGYESGESENNSEELIDEEEENEEVARALYMEGRRAQGSRSVNALPVENFGGEDEKYYFGVVKLGSQMVDHVLRTMPPPEEYLRFKPLERVAYIFYCAVYKKPYQKIQEFRNIFNREYFNYVCSGDTDETALYKICKSMQDQYTLKQLEASRLAYEKAQKEAAESEKLDFNQHRIVDPDDYKVAISQPEEVLSNGPLHYHSCLQFATIGVGGKLVVIRPAGTVDAVSGHVLSTTSVHVDDLRTLLHFDEQSGKVIESVQNFKGPLIAGQTPTHSVRLYIQRQIDALRQIRNAGDVKKSEVVDALLIWQLLEIMVQQHGRVTGPDIATLLTVASEELAEKTGIPEGGVPDVAHKTEAKERFNKFLLGGHINEAVESAISDGLYADAMTLIRRLNPNDAKKIEEIETRFMNLRSIDDPFATLVAVANDQLPPILTNSAFDDDNNWKRHAAIVLANLQSQIAMQTIYRLGLLLARRNRNCAADFCLLVCCILAGYDPFTLPPSNETDGQERSREHIGLVHSGSSLLNRVDGLAGIAGFSFTDLHATDIFDYALRLGNNIDSPLAKSVDYQMARIEYAKKLASYGGFATDAFRYCTEVARSLWTYIGGFDKNALLDLCDLAESLQYVAATTPAEIEWIALMRMMLDGVAPYVQDVQAEPLVQNQEQVHSLASEAQKWHDEHQAPIEITNRLIHQGNPSPPMQPVQPPCSQPVELHSLQQHVPTVHRTDLLPPTITSTDSSYESTKTGTSVSTDTVNVSTSRTSTIEPTPPSPLPKIVEQPVSTPPSVMKKFVPVLTPPVNIPPQMEIPQQIPKMTPPPMTPPATQPRTIISKVDPGLAKSPRTELEDLWEAASPVISQPVYHQQPPPAMSAPLASMVPPTPAVSSTSTLMQPKHGQPSVPNTKTTAPPTSKQTSDSTKTEQNASWFGSIRQKIIKSIPSANQMILPDDKKPSIVWDEATKRYVGAGVVQVVAGPPPGMSASHLMGGGADSNKSSTSSLQTRKKYIDPMGTSETPSMNTEIPKMDIPSSPQMKPMSFMLAAADDYSSENPFSVGANPTIPSESGSKQNKD